MDTSTLTIEGFLDALASKEPTPGGGAVAGVLAALATSLGNMVLAYSTGKKSLQEHASLHEDCIAFFQAARAEAIELSNADAAAYDALNKLWKLPKDDPHRMQNWSGVVTTAISVPIRTMELCARVLTTLQTLVENTNTMLASDLAIGAIAAEAAARAANWNVQVNIPLLDDEDVEFKNKAAQLLHQCKDIANAIETSCGL